MTHPITPTAAGILGGAATRKRGPVVERPAPLRQAVFEALVEMIITRELEPGQHLVEKDLAEHGMTPDDLRARRTSPPIGALIAFEVERARRHYALAADGIPMLDPTSQACIRTAYSAYGAILDQVVRAGYDVFGRRATVSWWWRATRTSSSRCWRS